MSLRPSHILAARLLGCTALTLGTAGVTFAQDATPTTSAEFAQAIADSNADGRGYDILITQSFEAIDPGATNHTQNLTLEGDLQLSGLSGTGGLSIAGPFTLITSGVNSYAGGTTIGIGKVLVAVSGGLGTGPVTLGTADSLLQFVGASAGDLSISIEQGGSLFFAAGADAGSARIDIASASSLGGGLYFTDTSSAGSATIINARGMFTTGIYFLGSSTAGNAHITNEGRAVATFRGTSTAGAATIVNDGGSTFFGNSATAGSATITNMDGTTEFGGSSSAGDATIINETDGATYLYSNATGANARIINRDNGLLDIASLNGAGTTLGSIEGAGEFHLGSKTLTVGGNGFDTEVTGVIDGTGSLVKTGAGKLTLSGVNAYTGTTSIEAGELEVNGSVAGTLLSVASGARLSGSGSVTNTEVLAGGTVSPGSGSVGTLTVNGDLVIAAGARYEVDVAETGNGSDRIAVTGTAELNGGSVVHVGLSGAFDPDAVYTILTAGAVEGRFDAATSDFAFLTPTLSYDGTSVEMKLTRNSVEFDDVALTANERAIAQALERLAANNEVVRALLKLDTANARGAFRQLVGDVYASMPASSAMSATVMANALTQRLMQAASDYVRQGSAIRGYAASPVLENLDAAPVGISTWISGFGGKSELSGDGNAADVEQSGGGFLAGADAQVYGWTVGAFGGYGRSATRADGAQVDADNYHLGLYAGTHAGDLAFRSGLSYTWSDLSSDRTVAFPGFSDHLTADYGSQTFQAFGELAYRFATPLVDLEPFANLSYIDVETDGFSETGGPAALTVEASDLGVAFTTIGLRAEAPVALGEIPARLHGSIGWRHAYGDTLPTGSASIQDSSFTVAGSAITRDAAVFGAGADFDLTGNATLGAGYHGQIGGDSQESAFSGALKVSF